MSTPGSSSFTSRCPGAIRWRTLSDGKIEVEGLGIPYAPTTGYHADGKFISDVWAKYKDDIRYASERTGIPSTWILALIIVESRGVNHPPNSAGAGGLMGMMRQATTVGLNKVGINRQSTAADVADPATNILAGAGYMLHNAQTFGFELPTVAVAHNAGSPKCSPNTRCKDSIDGGWNFDGSTAANSMGMVEDCTRGRSSAYAMRAVQINNSAIDMGFGDSSFWLSQDVVLVLGAVAFTGAMIWGFQKQFNEAVDFIFGPLHFCTLLLLLRSV